MYSIAIVGPPGCGKSSVINLLRKKHNRKFTISFLEEVATKLLKQIPSFRPLSPALMQAAIATTQVQAEEAVFDAFDQNGVEDAILITDRGVFDFFCYTTSEQLKYLHPNFCFRQYDLVIYLEPSPVYCGKEGNPLRSENEEQVAELAQKTLEIWKSNNEDFVNIPFCDSIDKKAELVCMAINNFFNKEIFI